MIKIMFVFLILFNGLFLYGQSSTSNFFPKNLQKRYYKLQKRDTLITYQRNCAGCDMHPLVYLYFIYKKSGRFFWEVYGWNSIEKDAVRLDTHIEHKKNKLKSIVKFVANNFDSISYETQQFSQYSKRERRINDTLYEVVDDGHKFSHGPYIKFEIKFSGNIIEGNIFGPLSISEFSSRVPKIGFMSQKIHELYSVYTTDKIIDSRQR